MFLDQGKSHIGHIKNKKVDPYIPLTDQLSAYRQKLNPFYRTKNINIVTENQVKSGEEVFSFTSTEFGEDITKNDYYIDKATATPREIPTDRDKTQCATLMAATITTPKAS